MFSEILPDCGAREKKYRENPFHTHPWTCRNIKELRETITVMQLRRSFRVLTMAVLRHRGILDLP